MALHFIGSFTDPADPVRSYGAARILMLLLLFGTVVSVGLGAKFLAERLARDLGATSTSEIGVWAGILGAGAALARAERRADRGSGGRSEAWHREGGAYDRCP